MIKLSMIILLWNGLKKEGNVVEHSNLSLAEVYAKELNMNGEIFSLKDMMPKKKNSLVAGKIIISLSISLEFTFSSM